MSHTLLLFCIHSQKGLKFLKVKMPRVKKTQKQKTKNKKTPKHFSDPVTTSPRLNRLHILQSAVADLNVWPAALFPVRQSQARESALAEPTVGQPKEDLQPSLTTASLPWCRGTATHCYSSFESRFNIGCDARMEGEANQQKVSRSHSFHTSLTILALKLQPLVNGLHTHTRGSFCYEISIYFSGL